MKKKIVLLDSDQVIADLLSTWLKVYNERYEDTLSIKEFGGTWSGVKDVVKPECGEKIYDLLQEPGFFQTLSPVEGAIEGVKNLQGISDVYIVTAYAVDPETAKGKVEWYKQNLPSVVDEEALILCKPKFLIYGDVLVDDSLENLEKWSAFMRDVVGKYDFHAICFAAPHNVDAEEEDFVDVRVENWDELLAYLNMVLT